MKQYIRFCIVSLLAVLLFSDAVQEVDAVQVPVESQQTCCFISQAQPTHQTFQRFNTHFALVSPCLEHVDVTQVPGDKITLLPFAYRRMLASATIPFKQPSQHYTTHPVPDPHFYYVFGLRKIII